MSFNPNAMPVSDPVVAGGVMSPPWTNWLLDLARAVAVQAQVSHRQEAASLEAAPLITATHGLYRVSVFVSGPGAHDAVITIHFTLSGIPQVIRLTVTDSISGPQWYSAVVLVRTDDFTPLSYEASAMGGAYDLDVVVSLEATP